MTKAGDIGETRNFGEYHVLTVDEAITSARIAFGHIPGRSDLELLTLRVSQLDRLARERLRALECATVRASRLEAELRHLKSSTAGEKV